MRRIALQPFSVLYVVAGIVLSALLLVVVSDSATAERLSEEWNLVENLTVVLYVGVIAFILFASTESKLFRYHTAFVVSLLMMRELDMHKELTAGSVLKFSYYLRPPAPIFEKLVAASVVLACAYALVRYIPYGKTLLSGLRARVGHAYATAAALVMLPITKSIDAAPRILRKDFGHSLSQDVAMSLRLFEEVLELGIPLLMLWACYQYRVMATVGEDA